MSETESERQLGDTEVEATGETVGEAKWSALRELERRFPGIDKSAVQFAVLSEGERGLLGVGYAPARVIASAGAVPPPAADAEEEPGSPAARMRRPVNAACTQAVPSAARTWCEWGKRPGSARWHTSRQAVRPQPLDRQAQPKTAAPHGRTLSSVADERLQ